MKKQKKIKPPKLPKGHFKISDARCITIRQSPEQDFIYEVVAEFKNKPWVMSVNPDLNQACDYAIKMAISWELNIELTSGVEAQISSIYENKFPKFNRPHKVTNLPDPIIEKKLREEDNDLYSQLEIDESL